ncbi:Uu.00g135690.m01.CDS01 [Anthostomella pinea]|uniref:Uu.00g135690.m01.CDS01 n=1 Tax=Anthostomella pinea TaxID=933095 RepID=A0AAI8VPU0_9PEZI|nr:Uu.00g135690.m01.CDS01 [Anthostomella pinea]
MLAQNRIQRKLRYLRIRQCHAETSRRQCLFRPYLAFSDIEKKTTYVALSYCWGTNPNPSGRTTDANINEQLECIKVGSLPKTIRDAVLVARGLEAPYLWVDALCIIQGNARDWQLESAEMADIYSNSYCTIAATTAENSDQGCLGSHPLSEQPCQLSWEATDLQEKSSIIIYPEIITPNRVEMVPAGSVLTTRGWTLQEMILSPRVLHHTDIGILWACKTMHASEQETGLVPAAPDPFAEVIHMLDEHQVFAQPYKDWRKHIGDFTRRNLTVVTDRLPALAGLAKRLKEKTGATYLAGISTSHIVPNFEIGVLVPASGDTLIDTATAAKISEKKQAATEKPQNGGWEVLQKNFEKTRKVFRLLKAEVTVKGENPLGEVSDGFLQIEGKVGLIQTRCESELSGEDLRELGQGFDIGGLRVGLWAVDEQASTAKPVGAWSPDCEMAGDSWGLMHFLQVTQLGVGLVLRLVGPGETFERIGLGRLTEQALCRLETRVVTIV